MTPVNPHSSSAARYRWRRFRLIAGSREQGYRRAEKRVADSSFVWIGRKPPAWLEKALPPEKIDGLLGQEVTSLVFDAHDGFDADAFAIAVGLVTGGGQFLLLTPPLTQWQASGSRFLRRLAGLL
ncbi:tRNA(Met) cytidine acetyltransferase TmcA domain-containing protein, partial [Thiolapillus sp.]